MANFRPLLLFSLSIGFVLLIMQFFTTLISAYTWALWAYFVALTAISHLLLSKGVGDDPFDFYNNTMGSFAIRLFVSASILLAFFYYFPQDRLPFAVTFFIFYFLFTGFEMKSLLSKLHQKNTPTGHEKK